MMNSPTAVIVSARRSALGRVGGLHRNRRLEEFARPVITTALADAGCDADQVTGLIMGNATAGRNAARAVALASGLPESAFALTLDSQCLSGLDAILDAVRRVSAGEADVIVAGGAESLSTAPWRIGRPKNPYQMPHFIGFHPQSLDSGDNSQAFEADEVLARARSISRGAQDAYVVQSHLAAELARERRQFIGEIVGQRATPEEMRDQNASEVDPDTLAEFQPFQPDDGTVTPGNVSALADGAAFAVVVSGKTWAALGKPKGLVLQRSLVCGVNGNRHAEAAAAALDALLKRGTDKAARDIAQLAAIETSEASAIEAIALVRALKLADGVLNASGGALVRGLPLGAASAVALVRLFSRMLRTDKTLDRHGAVIQRAGGGLGLAAVFQLAH
jgi:acetyl-CoA C-acetyltransferase